MKWVAVAHAYGDHSKIGTYRYKRDAVRACQEHLGKYTLRPNKHGEMDHCKVMKEYSYLAHYSPEDLMPRSTASKMTDSEYLQAASKVMTKQFIQLLGTAYDRWQDEKQYEPWKQYQKYLLKQCKAIQPDGFECIRVAPKGEFMVDYKFEYNGSTAYMQFGIVSATDAECQFGYRVM